MRKKKYEKYFENSNKYIVKDSTLFPKRKKKYLVSRFENDTNGHEFIRKCEFTIC